MSKKKIGKQLKPTDKVKNFKLKLGVSDYSKRYYQYMRSEYAQVQKMIIEFVRHPLCSEYYLNFPLEALIQSICKKLLVNIYEFVIFAHLLLSIPWSINKDKFLGSQEYFPSLIHLNDPTDFQRFNELSVFLFLSCYSIKEFLNQDNSLIQNEMTKLYPKFTEIEKYWKSQQSTIHKNLSPKLLNSLFISLHDIDQFSDYNVYVDKILQISPCYDMLKEPKVEVDETLNFGYKKAKIQQVNRAPFNEDIKQQELGSFDGPQI